ncbi:unnamed protein product [Ostreobium quekettii]|uniref:Uncharacterized protein n=1 Tax=Ostreobium quekettii TaxID=121088 RepID=A0A8S1IVJ4_9CHLO|nr:unnamed protein product [Ostreobium quekettii]
MLRGVTKVFPGVRELELLGCRVDDSELQGVLQATSGLQSLDLSGCTKLSPTVGKVLFGDGATTNTTVSDCSQLELKDGKLWGTGPSRDAAKLKLVNLQRCFQVTDVALTDALKCANSVHSELHCVLFSQLNLLDWISRMEHVEKPFFEQLVADVLGPEEEQMVHDLVTGRAHCVGGGKLALKWQSFFASCSLRILALNNCGWVNHRAFEAIATCCPNLSVLCLGGTFVDSSLPEQSIGEEISDYDAIHRESAQAVANSGIDLDNSTSAVCLQLLTLLQCLPRLYLLDITFFPPGTGALLKNTLSSEVVRLPFPQSEALEVLDLSSTTAARRALDLKHEMEQKHAAGTVDHWKFDGLIAQGMDMALRGAVNCTMGRPHGPTMFCQTTLHRAAEEGNVTLARAVLSLGAATDTRGRSGATALFQACFKGHVQVALELLRRGADAWKGNKNEETPLYIAALRGHAEVVDLLLSYFECHGIDWIDSRSYGDGWTPLQAAAVADRCSVARCLLLAAAHRGEAMCCMTNKHGQTALHVAARRGCMPMVKALCQVGGGALVVKKDQFKRTAVDVAYKHSHHAVAKFIASATSCRPAALSAGGYGCRWEMWRRSGKSELGHLHMPDALDGGDYHLQAACAIPIAKTTNPK